MAAAPNVTPLDIEATFEEEGIDARALITRTDKRGIIIFASKAYRQMTKYSKEELIGKPHSIVRHPCMPEAAFKEMWDTILQCKRWRGLVKNLRKDGKYYWVIVKIDPIDVEGNVIENTPERIAGFLAIRREPSRTDVEKIQNYYKAIRKAELLEKKRRQVLKKWEEELLNKLWKKNFL